MTTRRRRGVRVRRQVRRLELWPVAKLALAFHLACAVVTLGALVVVWQVGRKLGTVDRVAKFLEDVGFARDFEIKGPVLFRGSLGVAGVLVLINTVGTVVLAFLFNSLSGLLGGLVFSVLEEAPRLPAAAARSPLPVSGPAPPPDVARQGKHRSKRSKKGSAAPAVAQPEGVGGPGEHENTAQERGASVSAMASLPSPTVEPETVTDDWLQTAREATS